MKSTAFNQLVSEACQVELKTVTLYARLLKEAGWLTTGVRGRNAPHMTPLDLARITIALLATDKPTRAVERLERFRNLPFCPELSRGPFPEICGLQEGTTLEEALVRLFSVDLDSTDLLFQLPRLEVQENHRMARMEYGEDGVACFRGATPEQEKRDWEEFRGIRRSRDLAPIELLDLHFPFYAERLTGKPWEEIKDKTWKEILEGEA